MAAPIISVENLGKRYRLRHHSKVPYTTFRDALAQGARRLFTPSPIDGGDAASEEEFWALKDVNFEIQQGDVVGIIGRNGAGKSTLLKVLSRITEPTVGRVRLRGRVASLLEVGTGFHQELTGRENIFLNGAILGMSKAEIRGKFDEIVSFAEVERFLDTPVKHYSSGMYVRLAFAVAAHLEPEILIVDEVLAVGDSQFQQKCIGKMREVAQGSGRTVLFVSHNMTTVSSLTDRVVILRNAQVDFQGDTAEGVRRYLEVPGSDRGRYIADKTNSAVPFVSRITLQQGGADQVHVSGEPMEITFEVRHESPIERGCFSFQIVNQSQQPVLHCSIYAPEETRKDLFRTAGPTILKCRIPRLALNVGSYTLRTYLTEPPGGAIFEALDGVCPFEVTILDVTTLWGWRPEVCAYHEAYEWETA
jgi:lipopolysaccharide transport system ATP-binding protein